MEPVLHCMIACQETAKTVQKKQLDILKTIVMKHTPAFKKIGGFELIAAVITNDSLEIMKVTNSLLEKREMRQLLLLMLKDLTAVYKENLEHVNALIDCYVRNCTPQAHEFIRESMRLAVNMVNIINDTKIRAEVDKMRLMMKENLEHAVQKLVAARVVPAKVAHARVVAKKKVSVKKVSGKM